MNTVRDVLQSADPLRHEPLPVENERDRIRQAIVAGASGVTPSSSAWVTSSTALWVTLASIVVGIVVVGSQIWPPGGSTLQAAIRFEVRLAEDKPAPGLREAQIDGSDRLVYLHDEIVVTNDNIALSRLVRGTDPTRFGVEVQFDAAGARKMRQATASHIGRPIAILIDGDVVMAPVVRAVVSDLAQITGRYTQTEAERIVSGIGVQ